MVRSSFLKAVIIVSFISLSLNTLAQQTSNYTEPQQAFDQAVDLYAKEKFGSALVIFDRLAKDGNALLNSNAEYFAALSSSRMDYPDATRRLTDFIEKYPQHARLNMAYFELGKRQMTEGDYRDALKSFAHVDKLELTEEQLDEYYFKTGYTYFKTDNLSKARENFAFIIDKPNKYQIPADYYYAHIAYTEQNYQTALKYFEKVKGDEAYGAKVNNYIAQIYSQEGRYAQLLQMAQPMLNSSGEKEKPELLRLMGDALFHLKAYEDAMKYYQQYLDTKPSKIPLKDSYEIAYTFYSLGKYDKAIEYFQPVTSLQDTLAQNAFYHLGDCYLKINQKRFAFNAFNSAYRLKKDPQVTEESLFNYAKLAVDLSYNPYNEAVNAVLDYLNNYPDSPRRDEAYGYLADLYLLTKNYKNALASFRQIGKRNARLEALYQKIAYYRGLELFNEQDYNGAIKLLDDARNTIGDTKLKALSAYWMGEAYYRTARWDESLGAFDKFRATPGAASLNDYPLSWYNTGYSHFKKKDYGNAATAFRKFLDANVSDVKLNGDANLRLADCNFMSRNYATAIEYYKKAINARVSDADYAQYQIGICYGVSGDLQNKIASLRQLLQSSSKSNYTDDALYEIGLAYNVLGRDADALEYYQRVVKDYPKSVYVKKSLLKIGLIYFNQDKDQEALAMLKRVAKEYPGTPESKEAMGSIKSIYVDMNKVDDYVDFTKEIPQSDISRSEQDSLTYIAAENQYMNGNCPKAIEGFNRYISKFPEGAFIIPANFYKAECDYRSQNSDQALKGYELVLSQPRSRFTANSAQKAAHIYHTRSNFQSALDNYVLLEETAEQPAQVMDAVSGQMQCNYQLKHYGVAILSAQKLLALDKLPENLITEAHITMARSAYALGNTELARKEFEETIKHSKNEMGAEAKYMLSQILFENGKYDECEKSVFALNDGYASYDYWIAKGFLLLSDVYVKKGNYYQAKQTLQSIIDNYEGQDLVMIAKEKLSQIADK